jgi:cell division control protein 45
VAGTVYLLATSLGREDNDLLWCVAVPLIPVTSRPAILADGGAQSSLRLAILGLTHQYISTRIDRDRYEHLQSLYLDEVARLNPTSLMADPSSTTVSSASPDDHAIKGSEELRFTMYRHWNLYESMAHSGYVASKMGIWREKGRGRLHGMLAKMGYVSLTLLVPTSCLRPLTCVFLAAASRSPSATRATPICR